MWESIQHAHSLLQQSRRSSILLSKPGVLRSAEVIYKDPLNDSITPTTEYLIFQDACASAQDAVKHASGVPVRLY